MYIEHLEQVKDRIEEIRRRFIDNQELEPLPSPVTPGPSFNDVLKKTQNAKKASCPDEIEPMVENASQKSGLDPAVIKAVINAESGFRSDAVSKVGAVGLMQLMPGTAKTLGVNPNDPAQNVEGGARYLKQLIDKFGSVELGLAAYNAGPGSVARYGGVPPYSETQRYVESIMQSLDYYK